MSGQSRLIRWWPELAAALSVVALLASTGCVEQSREKKKFGRTFESSSTGAFMPFNFAPVPEGKWVDPGTEWKMNAAPDMSGLKQKR